MTSKVILVSSACVANTFFVGSRYGFDGNKVRTGAIVAIVTQEVLL